MNSEQLEAMRQEYLAAGGIVQIVPFGVQMDVMREQNAMAQQIAQDCAAESGKRKGQRQYAATGHKWRKHHIAGRAEQ